MVFGTRHLTSRVEPHRPLRNSTRSRIPECGLCRLQRRVGRAGVGGRDLWVLNPARTCRFRPQCGFESVDAAGSLVREDRFVESEWEKGPANRDRAALASVLSSVNGDRSTRPGPVVGEHERAHELSTTSGVTYTTLTSATSTIVPSSHSGQSRNEVGRDSGRPTSTPIISRAREMFPARTRLPMYPK